MQPVIGCDAHKKFSVFVSVDQHGKPSRPVRVDHDRNLYCEYLWLAKISICFQIGRCEFHLQKRYSV